MGELDVEIKARVSSRTKERLANIASARGEGVRISSIVREAVSEYLAKQARIAESPTSYGSKKTLVLKETLSPKQSAAATAARPPRRTRKRAPR